MMTYAEVLARLDAAIARAERATPGPWKVLWFDDISTVGGTMVYPENTGRRPMAEMFGPNYPSYPAHENGTFVAHSRTEHPAFAKALRAIAEVHKPLQVFSRPACRGLRGDDVAVPHLRRDRMGGGKDRDMKCPRCGEECEQPTADKPDGEKE